MGIDQLSKKNVVLGDSTLVPIALVRWVVVTIIGLTLLIAPWLTIMYYKTSKIDNLEERLQVMENISVQTKVRLDSMEPLLKETRDTVVKILTSQPYSSR